MYHRHPVFMLRQAYSCAHLILRSEFIIQGHRRFLDTVRLSKKYIL